MMTDDERRQLHADIIEYSRQKTMQPLPPETNDLPSEELYLTLHPETSTGYEFTIVFPTQPYTDSVPLADRDYVDVYRRGDFDRLGQVTLNIGWPAGTGPVYLRPHAEIRRRGRRRGVGRR